MIFESSAFKHRHDIEEAVLAISKFVDGQGFDPFFCSAKAPLSGRFWSGFLFIS